MRYFAGVDTHKDSHTIVFLNAAGESVEQHVIATTPTGFLEAISAARTLGDVVWGLEGTGSYGRSFAEALCANGYDVFEVPGSFTKRYRKFGSRPGKSDPLDAQAIAQVVMRESGRLRAFEASDQEEAIRLHYDRRNRFVRQRTEAVNRLRAVGMRLNFGSLPKNLVTEKSLLTITRYAKIVDPSGYTTIALLDEVQDAVREIRDMNAKIKTVEHYLRPFVTHLAPELLAIHGISLVVAAGLIGHTGNLEHYRDAAAFAMRTGTAPIPCSSGRTSALRVNTGGDRQLNRCLHTIAMIQAHKADHPGKIYYDRKRAEGKNNLAALRSLKRQLATVVYYRLRSAYGRMHPQVEIYHVAA